MVTAFLAFIQNISLDIVLTECRLGFREVLKEVFARMDKDKSGKLNGPELMAVLMTEDLYSQDDIKALFEKCQDKDGDGCVSCQEFIDAAF